MVNNQQQEAQNCLQITKLMIDCVPLTTRRSEVPEYLHGSKVYLSLNAAAEMPVPRVCLKKDANVNSSSELSHLLCTMHFWSLKQFQCSRDAGMEQRSGTPY